MNHKFISFVALLAIATTIVADTEVTPTFVARSQGRDAARKIAGVSDKVHLIGEENYINFVATAEYAQSFRGKDIARSLFGDDLNNCQEIKIQGSQVADRCENAWLAEYFYLAPDYNSTFQVRPRIQNILLDLDLFVGLSELVDGMYLRIHGPINYTRWDLRFSEPCDIETTGSYDAGYFDSAVMLNNQLLTSFGDYARGDSPLNTSGTVGTGSTLTPVGVEFQGLNYAQIDGCSHGRTGFADLRFELGKDLLCNEDYQIGINVQVAAPTGSRTEAQRAFDPVIGNRNHWEVGGGLYGHYDFYHSEDGESQAGIYFDLSLTHMNRAKEQRTFDLCGKPNSRYMLAMKMGNPVNFLTAGDNNAVPKAQFKGVFTPVANLTTINVPVSVAIQADFAALLNYRYKKWNFDLGYNLYARSAEKFGRPQELKQCCPTLCDGSRDQWALKGDAHVFGFVNFTVTPPAGFSSGDPIALSATECASTIHKGTNLGFTSDDCTNQSTLQNCGVDNAQTAGSNLGSGPSVVFAPGLSGANDTIKTSLEPLFINCCDINLQRTRAFSNKIFGNISYTWDKECYTPYVGVGGFAEFGKTSGCDVCVAEVSCDQQCDNTSCDEFCCTEALKCSLSQWGVWLKGGVNFQ